jgi:hypothetical protein
VKVVVALETLLDIMEGLIQFAPTLVSRELTQQQQSV